MSKKQLTLKLTKSSSGTSYDDMEILTMGADLIDEFNEKQKDLRKASIKVEIDWVTIIRKHSNDIKFVRLGKKPENLREKHEQGL